MPKLLRAPGVALVAMVTVAVGGCGKSPPPAPPPADVPPSARPGADGPAAEVPPETREPADPVPARPPVPRAGTASPTGTPPTSQTDAPPRVVAPATPGAAAPSAPVAPPPRAPLAPEVRAALDAARARIAAGEAGEAIALLRAAEEKNGPSADLRLEQGRAFLFLAEQNLARTDDSFLVKGLVADAQMRWKQATALDASVPGAAVLRARIYRFEENPEAARTTLAAQIAAHPDDADAHALLGDMAEAARDWQAADVHWTKAATLDPANGEARLRATVAKQWLGMSADRIEAGYLEAARLLPDRDAPVQRLVKLSTEPTRQLALLQKVLDANPRAVTARIWIAHILRTAKPPDLKRAREVLEEAARIAPENPAVPWNLGLVLEDAGAPVDAVRAYVACIEASPADNCRDVSVALDRLLNDPGSEVARATPLTLHVRACDALVAKNPSDGSFGNNAGLWFRDVGRDYELSLRYYLASVAAAPDDQDFLNDTGLIYLFHLLDRKEECMKYFDKVVALVEEDGQEPVRGYWDTLENLCKYWSERGEWAKVVAYAKKRADPKAEVGGRPYPSRVAAQYGAVAAKKLAEAGR